MSRFTEKIDKQIEFNRGKNIFSNSGIFSFAKETIKVISEIESISPDDKQSLIDYATDKAIEEFCRVNQYYSFDSSAKNKLKDIYTSLFDNLQCKIDTPEEISKQHYERIKVWLKENNAFAEKIYQTEKPVIEAVPCSEYTAELQINILKIDVKQLSEPVLDIGCGINAHLVKYLVGQGIEAYGIDRFKFSSGNLVTADWLEYDYGSEKWGTIISHLGFTNHFTHHNLREDGNYLAYARTYITILNSLKSGGCFHYAPDLPFIEQYLDPKQFKITRYEISNYDFKATVVKKDG